MTQDRFDRTKRAVLTHIRAVFEQMEEELALSHEEKYALLEDAFENATDGDELRVAFDQWYTDHADDLELDHGPDELWDHAVNTEDEDEDEDEEEYEEGDDDEEPVW